MIYATWLAWSGWMPARSVPLGSHQRHWRLRFSTWPRCHGECGSQNQASSLNTGLDRSTPVHRAVPGGIAGMAVDDLAACRDPRDRLVPDIPRRQELSTRSKDPGDLVKRRVWIEPVEGLGRDDSTGCIARDRYVLGGSVTNVGVTDGLDERLSHGRHGLHPQHLQSPGDEFGRQDSCAGAKLDNGGACAAAHDVIDDRRVIRRSSDR